MYAYAPLGTLAPRAAEFADSIGSHAAYPTVFLEPILRRN